MNQKCGLLTSKLDYRFTFGKPDFSDANMTEPDARLQIRQKRVFCLSHARKYIKS